MLMCLNKNEFTCKNKWNFLSMLQILRKNLLFVFHKLVTIDLTNYCTNLIKVKSNKTHTKLILEKTSIK